MNFISNKEKAAILFEKLGADVSDIVEAKKLSIKAGSEYSRLKNIIRLIKSNPACLYIVEEFNNLNIEEATSLEQLAHVNFRILKLIEIALPFYEINPYYYDEDIDYLRCKHIGELLISVEDQKIDLNTFIESSELIKSYKITIIQDTLDNWAENVRNDIEYKLEHDLEAMENLKNAKLNKKISKLSILFLFVAVCGLMLSALFGATSKFESLVQNNLSFETTLIFILSVYLSTITMAFGLIFIKIFNNYHRKITINRKYLLSQQKYVKQEINRIGKRLKAKITKAIKNEKKLYSRINRYSLLSNYFDFYSYEQFALGNQIYYNRDYMKIVKIYKLLFILSFVALVAITTLMFFI